jgi:hypothetical protein
VPLYIRTYFDYCYEIIYTEGRVKKKRIHLLINPGKNAKLKGHAKKEETEINVESLTHVVAMETSVQDPKIIDRTTKFAEITNKPIITNDETAILFKENGLSIKQLRILGYDEEVIDGLRIDPVYSEELPEVVKNSKRPSITSKITDIGKIVTDVINPLKWKPVEKIKTTVKNGNPEIDPSKPLAIYITFGKVETVLVPLDTRAISNINKLIATMNPKIVVLPNLTISDTLSIGEGAKLALVLHETHKLEQVDITQKSPMIQFMGDLKSGFNLNEWTNFRDMIHGCID